MSTLVRWFGFTTLLLCSLGSFRVASAEVANRVDPAVRALLASEPRVRVMVLFDVPKVAEDARTRLAIKSNADAIISGLPAGHYSLKHRYLRVSALALEIDATALDALAASATPVRVGLDEGGVGSMLQSAPLARVTDTLNAGLLGAGAKIAVIDSGIDTDHLDFAGRIVAQQCFCAGVSGPAGCCPNGADSMAGTGSAEDDHGHGTNVSGIAAGGGAVAQRGGAPSATIVAVKVLDANNSFCCASDVVAAFDWVRQNHPDTDAVNASLGTGALFAGVCDSAQPFTQALALAVTNLVQNGTTVFVSTGNQGSASTTSAPACVSDAFAVGAVWDANLASQMFLGCTEAPVVDKATCFTNSNANVDLYAPGAFVTSSGRGGGLSTFGGTSQATPLTAGCATALRGAFPDVSVARMEAALETSPTTIVDAKNGLSFPRLDCAAAARRLAENVFSNSFEG